MTQGQWKTSNHRYDTTDIEGKGRCGIIVARAYGENHSENARLIAAAPELLTALRRLCFAISTDGANYRDAELYKIVIKAAHKAAILIKKLEAKNG